MKILFLSEYYPPYAPGGAEWSTARWARLLADSGHEVLVSTLKFGDAPPSETEGITVRRCSFPQHLEPGQRQASRLLTSGPLFALAFGLFSGWQARRFGAEVIHAQTIGSFWPGIVASRLARRPMFLTVRDLGLLCPLAVCLLDHGQVPDDCGIHRLLTRDAAFFWRQYAPDLPFWRRPLSRARMAGKWWAVRSMHRTLSRVGGVAFVSQGLRQVYPSWAVSPSTRVAVIHNPLEPHDQGEWSAAELRQRYELPPGQLVLAAGKLSLGKGTPNFVTAASAVQSQFPEVTFLLVGKGELAAPPPPGVRVLGSIPHPALQGLYRLADVVVSAASWPEPLGRTIIEALGAGRPVVATAVGGTMELVLHEKTGLLVPPRNPQALAEAILNLLKQPDLARRLGDAGRDHVQNLLNPSTLVSKLIALYRQSGTTNA